MRIRAPRLRQAVLAAVGVGVILFFVSATVRLGIKLGHNHVVLERGALAAYNTTIVWALQPPGIVWRMPIDYDEVYSVYGGAHWDWKPRYWSDGTGRGVVVPLWLLLLPLLGYLLIPRAGKPDHCAKCGYDTRGLTAQRCPECGTVRTGSGQAPF